MGENGKVLMALSGGMDSATLLGLLLEEGYQVRCCSFTYGSKHNRWEQAAAEKIIQYYRNFFFHGRWLPDPLYHIDLQNAMEAFQSDLLLDGGEIPEGHYNDSTMSRTVVPCRNLIFSSIMAGVAASLGIGKIALGVHSGDHHIYPDCRPEFIKALDAAVYLASGGEVEVMTPLLHEDKHSILVKGFGLTPPVPYHFTRTCYKDQELSCGKCGACNERLEAFKKLGKEDPIAYE